MKPSDTRKSRKYRCQYVKNDGVTDGVVDFDTTEYSSHTLENPVDQTNGSEWVFVTRYRNGKKRWTTY